MNEKIIFTVIDTEQYREGKAAGEKNLLGDVTKENVVNNPYPKGTSEWVHWICGYNHALCLL